MTKRQAEAAAIEWAASYIISKGNLAGIGREWTRRGLRPAQRPDGTWTRASVTTILTNPRVAGYVTRLSVADRKALAEAGQPRPLHAPIVAGRRRAASEGQVAADLGRGHLGSDLPRAVRVRHANPAGRDVAGCARCSAGWRCAACGNTMAANHLDRLGYSIYRCQQVTRGNRPGPHACTTHGAGRRARGRGDH